MKLPSTYLGKALSLFLVLATNPTVTSNAAIDTDAAHTKAEQFSSSAHEVSTATGFHLRGTESLNYRFHMDTYVHGTSGEGTANKVYAGFYSYKHGYLGGKYSYNIFSNWLYDPSFEFFSDVPVDYVELETHGNDALLIEYAWLNNGRSLSQVRTSWGSDDNGQGWCLSTDRHDWKGWEGHVPAKTCFKRLRFESNGKVYKVR